MIMYSKDSILHLYFLILYVVISLLYGIRSVDIIGVLIIRVNLWVLLEYFRNLLIAFVWVNHVILFFRLRNTCIFRNYWNSPPLVS